MHLVAGQGSRGACEERVVQMDRRKNDADGPA
jgi:hypothetical protein